MYPQHSIYDRMVRFYDSFYSNYSRVCTRTPWLTYEEVPKFDSYISRDRCGLFLSSFTDSIGSWLCQCDARILLASLLLL